MTPDPHDRPQPAEAELTAQRLDALERDLEQAFPGRGTNLFVHTMLLAVSAFFDRFEDEDDLADILNAGLEASDWRLVRR